MSSTSQVSESALANWTDESLILEYQQNKRRECFELLMQRYEREMYSFLRRYLGNNSLAEDAFQGAFLMLHLKCDQFDQTRKFRPWFYAIATNQAIDVQRRNRRHRTVSLDGPGRDEPGSWAEKMTGDYVHPLDDMSRHEYRQWSRDAVSCLSDSLRQVVELVYFQGLRYREAADALDIPVGTVKSRMHAAMARLHDLWRDSFGSRGLEE
jgi:RNA polymerase sigma-70 factor, ECF subfamily